jgi:hypothetical protein
MPLENLPLTEIQLTDIQRLIDNAVIESKQLDYKEALPQDRDGKRDFLADVSAMANTLGGDILYGIVEQRDANGRPTGLPDRIEGIPINNWDTLRQGLEQAIRDGIEPRIQGIEVAKVDLAPDQAVVLVRIPRSIQAPHMVKSRPGFYARSAGGNNPMDVADIRQAFLYSATILERADAFRRSRINEVIDGQGPLQMYNGAKVFLHVVPLGTQAYALNFSDAHVHTVSRRLGPLHRFHGLDYRLNFDGQLNFTSVWEDGTSRSYVQIFRNGAVEFCDTFLLGPNANNEPQHNRIQTPFFEEEIIRGLHNVYQMYTQLSIPFPVAIFVSLVGVRGYIMYSTDDTWAFYVASHSRPIDRDDLILPGQLVDQDGHAEHAEEVILKPVFDTVWNAAGLPRSLAYNEQGEFIRRQGQ